MVKKKTQTPAAPEQLIALPDRQSLEQALRDAAAKSDPQLRKDIRKLHAAAARSAHNAVRDAILAGIQLIEAKKRTSHGHWSNWLAENFSARTLLSQRTAQRYINAAKRYLALDDHAKNNLSLETLSLTSALRGFDDSKKSHATPAAALPAVQGNDWLTPKPIIDASVKVLGSIDLDPAAEAAASNVPATQHLTTADDSLSDDVVWQGRVFLNPGCKGQLLPWVEKLITAFDARQVPAALLVLPAPGHHSWTPSLRTFPAAFSRDHLKVALPETDQLALVKQPLMFVYVTENPNLELFAKHFFPFSDIYVPFNSKESTK